MTYVVFILIVAAALLYLFFSESRRLQREINPQSRQRSRLLERQQSLKLSLGDIEYEKSVGKMDAVNFSRLQNEYLTEWEEIERKVAALPEEKVSSTATAANTASCPQCGTAILTATAKFCHACGGKLAQWLLAIACLSLWLAPADVFAFDISVTLQNGTHNRIETSAVNVQLLKLEKAMQPVTAKIATAGKVEFNGLPEMTAGPYMVQAVYRGVTYSRVIPPNMPSPAQVTLDIFESTAAVEKIRVRTLIELRRIEKGTLAGLMILFFVNSDKKTFVGGANGLEFYLPENAEIEQASVSVGTGASNIQWLKVNPQKTAKKGFFTAGQNVKPGERILQVMFRMPYDEKGTALAFQSLYPQDTGIQIIAEPENVEVRQGGKMLSRVQDENLGRGLIPFTASERQIALSLAGGSIAEFKKTEEAEIEIRSPLALWQKLIFPLVALALFSTVIWLKGRNRKLPD